MREAGVVSISRGKKRQAARQFDPDVTPPDSESRITSENRFIVAVLAVSIDDYGTSCPKDGR